MRKGVPEEKILIYGSYIQVAECLQHYNKVQTIYRTFASTWLLATFIGIGYVLSSSETDIPFHPSILAAFICLASASVMSLIWHMDLIVSEQQIAALVFEGIELEKQHPWLPQYYHNINKISSFMSYVNLKSIFYLGCLAVLFMVMGALVTSYIFLHYSHLGYLVPALTLIIYFVCAYCLIHSTKKTDPYQRLARLKGNNLV